MRFVGPVTEKLLCVHCSHSKVNNHDLKKKKKKKKRKKKKTRKTWAWECASQTHTYSTRQDFPIPQSNPFDQIDFSPNDWSN